VSVNCEFEKGLEYLRRSLDLGISANNLIMITTAKCAMCIYNYIFHGKIDLAYQVSKEALQTAQESGDIFIKGIAYSSHGMSCYCKGFFDEAEHSLLQALSFCGKSADFGWGSWLYGFLGHVYSEMGKYEKAQDYYREGISILERARLYPFWVNMWTISIARARVLNHDKDITLSEVFEYYGNIHVKAVKGWTARYIGEILLNMDEQHITEAEAWVTKAIEADKRNNTMWSLGNDYALYAELFKRKGDLPKAKENLNKAIEILKECGADRWVENYQNEMASLS
jgi:tetratricopeptide (TPR) repeat protein